MEKYFVNCKAPGKFKSLFLYLCVSQSSSLSLFLSLPLSLSLSHTHTQTHTTSQAVKSMERYTASWDRVACNAGLVYLPPSLQNIPERHLLFSHPRDTKPPRFLNSLAWHPSQLKPARSFLMCNLSPSCLWVPHHPPAVPQPYRSLIWCRWARQALGPVDDLEIQPVETCTLSSDLCLGQDRWQGEQLSRSGLFVVSPAPCTFLCL